MRHAHRLALLFIPCAALACTALLGDFSVGDGGAGDVNVPDEGIDGGGDGNVIDSPADAPDSATQPIKCSEDSNARKQLNQSVGVAAWDLIQMAKLTPAHDRIVADTQGGGQGGLHAFDYVGNNNVTHFAPTTGQIQQVMDILRLKDRFVALTWDHDINTGNNFFAIFELLDSANAWGAETPISTNNPLAFGDASAIDRLQATMAPVDPLNQTYFVIAYDLEQSDGISVVYAGYEKPSNLQPLVVIDNTQAPFAYELKSPSVAANATNAFLLLGGNGPTTLNALLYTMSLTSPVGVTPRSLTNNQGASYFPAVFQNSSAQGLTDIAIIEANLNTVQATYHVGQVGFPQLATFDPSTLPTSAPPMTDAGVSSIPDLLLDKAEAHAESPGNGEHVIAWSRTSDLNGPLGGFNFEWWDAQTGAVRSRQTGATGLMKDIPDGYRATSVFSAPPLGAFAQFDVAFSREPASDSGNGGSTNGDLWFTTLSCALQ